MAEQVELGFVGAGKMATALCKGVVNAGLLPPKQVLASDPEAKQREAFARETGAPTTARNADVCSAPVLILAVKPQIMPAVLAEIGPQLGADTLVISIAAGIPIRMIEAASSRPLRVIRAMPNTPMRVGQGAAALCRGTHATTSDLARARALFESCAVVIEVEEQLIHAVTALSGSGPAYVFYLAEIMARAGAEMGLGEADAVALANQTLLGAARMLVETGERADALRRDVTSPGGTTEAAIRHMEETGVRAHITEAMKAALRRSQELASPDRKK